jgi:hypothetical protein
MTNHTPIGYVWSDSTVLCHDAATSLYDPDKDEGNEMGSAGAIFEWDEDATTLYCEEHNQTLLECAGYQLDDDDEPGEEEEDSADICNLSYSYRSSLPTLSVGQSDNLKIETDKARVWLARTSIGDGEKFKHRVSIENYRNGKWETVYDYEAL